MKGADVTEGFVSVQAIVDADDLPCFAIDRELRYTAFNRAHAVVMRALYGADIALGGRLPDYQTVAADRETSTANLERALAGEHVVASAFSGEEGKRRSFEVVHVPQTDPHGTVVGVVVRAHDVTEGRRAEEQLRASEEDYRALAEAVPQIVWTTDPDGKNTYFNQQWVDYTGMSLDESYGDGWNEPFHPDDRQRAWDARQRATQNDAPYSVECRLRRADGAYRWWLVRGAPQRDASGTIVKWFGTCTDIEEIKSSEAALRESEERYRQLFEAESDAVFLVDNESRRILEANSAALAMYGYSHDEITSLRDLDLTATPDQLLADTRGAPAGRRIIGGPVRFHRRKDGSQFPAEITAGFFTLRDRTVRIAAVRDITERKRAEEELRRTHETLVQAQTIAHLGSFEYVAATQLTVWSEEEYRIYGLDPTRPSPTYDEMLATCIYPDDAALLHESFTKAMQSSSVYELEHRIVRPDGSVRWVYDLARPYFDAQGELVRYVGTTLDITERRRAEEAARESAANYDALFDTALLGVAHGEVVLDDQGRPVDYRYLRVNETFEELTGLKNEDVVGPTMREIVPGFEDSAFDFIGVHGKVALTGEPVEFEQYQEHLGRWYSVHVYSPRKGQFVSMFSDITARRQAEERLTQMTRLYATLSQVNQTIVRVKQPEELYPAICDVAVEFGEFALAWVGLLDEASGDVRPVAANGADLAKWPFETVNIHKGVSKDGLVATAIRSREIAITGDVESDEKMRSVLGQVEGRDYHSIAAIPFGPSGQTVAVLVLVSQRSGLFKEASEVGLLEEMGKDISFALDTMATEAERERADEALRESGERFSTVFRSSGVGMALTRLSDSRFTDVNGAFCALLGFSREEVIGQTSAELGMWRDIDQRQQSGASVQETGRSMVSDAVVRTKSGETRHVLLTSEVITVAGERYVLSGIQDITERRRAENRLRESEDSFRTLAESVPQIVWMTTPDGMNTYFNQQWVDYTGMTFEESYGNGWSAPFHPDDRERASDAWQRATSEDAPYSLECRLRRSDGVYRWWLIRGAPLRGASGEVLKWFGTCTDIEDLKRAEEQLVAQAARLKVLADASQAFAAAGHDYQKVLDQVVREVAGLLADSCQVRLVSEDGEWLELAAVYAPDADVSDALRAVASRAPERADDPGIVAQVLRDGKPAFVPAITAEQLRASYPPEFWPVFERFPPHSFILVPLRVQGRSIGGLGLTRYQPERPAFTEDDVKLAEDLADRAAMAIANARLLAKVQDELHQRERAEEEIRRLNAELEERVQSRTAELEAANKELEAFAYSVSHDLRAPLRHISGYASILRSDCEDALDDDGRSCLDTISDSAREMGVLIDDLLQFSRIGRAEMKVGDVDMAAVLEEALAPIRQEAQGRAIEWSLAPLPHAFGDPALLRQVWSNLLENAVKYTRDRDPARIEVGVAPHDGASANGASPEQMFFVRDNGVGFDMQYAHKLFGVFQRLHTSAEFEGTGIGLANVSRIVTRHGGRVWAEAAPDEGATFFFTLPRRKGAP